MMMLKEIIKHFFGELCKKREKTEKCFRVMLPHKHFIIDTRLQISATRTLLVPQAQIIHYKLCKVELCLYEIFLYVCMYEIKAKHKCLYEMLKQ